MPRIDQLIFDQASLYPQATAVEYDNSYLTYSELKIRSLQISRMLKDLGLSRGDKVGIYMNRSVDTVPLMLGIWNAGGVIVPINPETPVKALEWLISGPALRLIVTIKVLKDNVEQAAQHIGWQLLSLILMDGLDSDADKARQVFIFRDILWMPVDDDAHWEDESEQPDEACYIIHTSGSRGRPKGVVGTHHSLLHYLKWQAKEFSINNNDRCSQIAHLSFDFSLKEIFVPLLCGGCVCLADRSVINDPARFIRWLNERRITILCCVPTLFRSVLQLSDHQENGHWFQSLRSILISGEMLRWDDVSNWRKRYGSHIPLINLYGPTESGIIKLFYRIPETKRKGTSNVPVGKPISDTQVLIFDDNNQPCSAGQIGEIVILSEWIARGYLNVVDENHHSFISLLHNGVRIRAYRTGDMGRMFSDGIVEVIGRKDRQTKVYGHRVELDEIESVLSEHPAIRDVAVVALNGETVADIGSSPTIICYYTVNGVDIAENDIKGYVKDRLLPQVFSVIRFSCLEELPLSANGKIDRLKLESIRPPNKSADDHEILPVTLLTMQQQLCAVWAELLALESVDTEANFFELGGDSILAIQLLRSLREDLRLQVMLVDLYQHPTISQLSAQIVDRLK